ncbi:MAG: hypothetical protein IPM95_06745 [Sphingobacteriales bacterium]|nr:hypothetical protein [Sphingobacteriales bacterium]
MKLLLENKRFITLYFVLVLILLSGQRTFAQSNYCGPQTIIDKCNPNRVSMEIEVYDITSSLINRRRDEKKYQYKLDYKVTDNQLGTLIGSQTNIGPNVLTDNNYQPHYRLDVINQPNYLVKDLPNFRLVFSFKLHDVSFTKLARIYWKGFLGRRSYRRKQYGVYENATVFLKKSPLSTRLHYWMNVPMIHWIRDRSAGKSEILCLL